MTTEEKKRILNTTCLVVGGVSPIGLTIAREIAKIRKGLVLTWHTTEPVDIETGESELEWIKIDLQEFDQLRGLVEKMSHVRPPWTELVYVAGDYGQSFKPDITEEDWKTFERIFKVNATAFQFLCQSLASKLESKRERGSVVAIGSTSASQGYTGAPIYAASKAALQRIVLDAAWRFAKVMSVNVVSLGPVDTEFLRQTPKGIEKYEEETPTGRLTTPEEVAATVSFLLNMPQVNGAILNLDGGRIVR